MGISKKLIFPIDFCGSVSALGSGRVSVLALVLLTSSAMVSKYNRWFCLGFFCDGLFLVIVGVYYLMP